MAKLLNNEQFFTTEIVRLNLNDLKTIGNGGTKLIGTIPVGGALELVGVAASVTFAGSTALTVSVGTTLSNPVEHLLNTFVGALSQNFPIYNTGSVFLQASGSTTILGGMRPVAASNVAQPVYIKLSDATIANTTAGEIVVVIRYVDFGKFQQFLV